MTDTTTMDRNLALEAVRVTEAAALSASRLMGRGDEKAADQAAVDAMRQALNSLLIDGTVVVGGGLPDGVVDLDQTPSENLRNLARAKKAEIADLVVCILDRPRHAELIAKVRESGARIMLIGDGDVSGVIATSDPETGIDIYM